MKRFNQRLDLYELQIDRADIVEEINSAREGSIRDFRPPLSLQHKATQNSEGFEDINNLAGWITDNRSTTVGSNGWFQGNTSEFNAHSGSNASYIA